MKPFLIKPLALAVSALTVMPALAQEAEHETHISPKEKELGTVTVTATRYQQDINKIPGAITVIDEQNLKTQLSVSDDLTSVLANLVPSMTPSRQKLSNQGENLRGRTALIMVDGVPQNNPLRNGNRYAYSIDSSMLDRIDVVSGANAAHGMGATGGLINYQTLSASEGDNALQTLGIRLTDSFEDDGLSSKVWYNLRHHDEDYDIVFATSWHDQGLYYDGKGNAVGMNAIQGETQDSTTKDYFVKLGANHGAQRLEFSANNYQLKSNNNYVPVKGDFDNDIPGTVEPGSLTGEPVNNEAESYNLTYRHQDLGGGTLTSQFFYQDFEAVYGEAGWWPTPDTQIDQGAIVSTKQGIKLAYTKADLLDRNDSWVVGVDIIEDETQQVLKQTGLDVTPPMSSLSVAPFIQGDLLATEKLRVSAGLRHESIQVKVDDSQTLFGYGLVDDDGTEYGQVDINGGSQNFSELVFNMGAVYSLTNNINLTGGYNQGFGLPDIGRVLRGNWVGDDATPGGGDLSIDFNDMPAVEPVVTDNFEIGINYTDEQLTVAASTYYSLAKDGANLSLNEGGTYDVVRQRTEIHGAEFTGQYQATDQLQLSALYSVVRGEVDSDGDGSVDSDMDLKNVSPDRIMLAADYFYNENIQGRLQANHLKDAKNTDADQSFEGYTLVDATVSYDTFNYGRINFAIENLSDEYYTGYFSQIRNHSSYYFAGRGRTYSLAYELSF